MAVNDFTGKNIQDTYQKVVQTDGTNLADGTGSLLPISFEGNDVIVPGALRAESYIVSESIINVSSGSTVFGNSSDDTHTFIGSVTSSGNISASGYITSKYIRMSGPESAGNHRFIVAPPFQETEIDAILLGGNVRIAQKQAQIAAGISPSFGSDVGNLSVFGHVSASQLQSNTWVIPEANGKVYLSYDTSTDYLELGGAAQVGAYPTKGIKFYTSGSLANGFGSIFFGGDTGYIEADGYVSGSEFRTTGAITASGPISSSGNLIGLQIYSDARIESNNRVGIYNTDSTNFVANETHPTKIQGTNIELDAPVTASVISASLIQTPVITGETTEATGLVVSGFVHAHNIVSSGSIVSTGSLEVIGNITASGNISASGTIIANNFSASNAFHVDAHSSFEFTIANNHFNMKNNAADKDLNFLTTAGEGTINFGTNNNGAEVVIGTGGHITASGNISASGDITAVGNLSTKGDLASIGSGLIVRTVTDAGVGTSIPQPTSTLAVVGDLFTNSHITASGNISASGNLISDKVHANVIAGKVDGTGIILGSESDIHVTASGNISSSGDLTVNNINGTINGGTF